MKKKVSLPIFAFMAVFTIGTLFADDFQCDDPTNKKVTITFMDNYVYVNYQGNKAQRFDVVVSLKDGSRDIVHFDIKSKNTNQTRPTQEMKAAGPIARISNCDLKPY